MASRAVGGALYGRKLPDGSGDFVVLMNKPAGLGDAQAVRRSTRAPLRAGMAPISAAAAVSTVASLPKCRSSYAMMRRHACAERSFGGYATRQLPHSVFHRSLGCAAKLPSANRFVPMRTMPATVALSVNLSGFPAGASGAIDLPVLACFPVASGYLYRRTRSVAPAMIASSTASLAPYISSPSIRRRSVQQKRQVNALLTTCCRQTRS